MKSHDFTANNEDVLAANERHAGIVEVRESRYGKGVFALRDFRRGELVVPATARAAAAKDSHTVQTGFHAHALMDVPATLLNHSCVANAGPKDNDRGCYDWYAMKTIAKGEEIFIDYESFEYEIEGFTCSCGRPKCRGILGGFRVHGDQVLKQYGVKYIASYLREGEETATATGVA